MRQVDTVEPNEYALSSSVLIETLVQLRLCQGLSITTLSVRTGIDATAIDVFEQGRRTPSVSTVQAWARGVGARLMVIDTHGRASAAECAALVHDALASGHREAATQTLLQLVTNLRSSDALAVAALTADEPTVADDGWSWAIAGIVEIETTTRGLLPPKWVTATTGEPTAQWNPWGHELSDTVDARRVPEPLRRRGVLIESGELSSI